jgi:hypothetical protein
MGASIGHDAVEKQKEKVRLPSCRAHSDRLIIEEEVAWGDMPLRADLLLIRRTPTVVLPFPYLTGGLTDETVIARTDWH